jgi:hypothetical protein
VTSSLHNAPEQLVVPLEIPSGTGQKMSARVGYTRISTVAQTLDQQDAALEAAGVSNIFADTMSGARDDRPGLAALIEYVRSGDTVGDVNLNWPQADGALNPPFPR